MGGRVGRAGREGESISPGGGVCTGSVGVEWEAVRG